MAWLHLKSSNLFRTKNWFKTQKEANSAQHFIVLRNKSTEVEDIEDIKSKKKIGRKSAQGVAVATTRLYIF
jgi:hypothetical protein